MIFRRLISILMAYIIDLIIGDPPTWPHPVKIIGRLIAFLDRSLNDDRKIRGSFFLAIVLIIVTCVSFLMVFTAYRINTLFGLLVEALIIATTISQKGLKDAALEVYDPLAKKDLKTARQKLSYIVGRDIVNLNEPEITRATIETVAENTTDGITAPLFWAVLAGGPGAMVYRAINTCDSMVAYKNERYQNFGWASAKVDDFANWLPARLTGWLMLYLTPSDLPHTKKSGVDLAREAKKHASPNSGWTEAAIALSLGVELGGDNYYQGRLSPAEKIGYAERNLEKEDIKRTIQAMQRTSLFFLLITLTIGVIMYVLT